MSAQSPSNRIGWYNGVSPQARRATLAIQRAAIREGRMPNPTICSVCRFVDSDDPTGKNRVGLHDENYNRPLEAYPICRVCHGILHRRFERPARWMRLVKAHGDGWQWFERLSLDPDCRWRRFSEIYIDGLPLPRI